jgi:hypothetical protein
MYMYNRVGLMSPRYQRGVLRIMVYAAVTLVAYRFKNTG